MAVRSRPPLDPASVQVVPATGDRFVDVAAMVGPPIPGGSACWCIAPRLSSADTIRHGVDAREAAMRDLCASTTPPGLLAYVDGELAGWIGLGPRASMSRLVASRVIPQLDNLPVWSIVCFVIRSPYRRRGLARILLDAAIEFAAARGVPALEAYPIDPEGERVNVSSGYVGFTGTFEDAGFERVLATEARSDHKVRWLMRRTLP